MNHSDAQQEMLAERYLLNELPPDVRDAFEEHLFDCPECAFDLRAGAAFVDEAKLQLPGLTKSGQTAGYQSATTQERAKTEEKKRSLFSWWKPLFATPAFAAPVFATLLVVIGYQNFVTFPALRVAATEPRLTPTIAIHVGARGGEHEVIEADRKQGVALLIDVPDQSQFTSYSVDLSDPSGKLAWTHRIAAAAGGTEDGTLSLTIPGAGLVEGSYTLTIYGIAPGAAEGQRTEVGRRVFDVHFHN